MACLSRSQSPRKAAKPGGRGHSKIEAQSKLKKKEVSVLCVPSQNTARTREEFVELAGRGRVQAPRTLPGDVTRGRLDLRQLSLLRQL